MKGLAIIAPSTEALRRLALATGGFVERLTPATDVDRVVARLAKCIGPADYAKKPLST